MKKIVIIGGGFTGTMTAVHLLEKSTEPCEIMIINKKDSLNKGTAYNPYSDKQLLNVITGKMSAFADKPEHFLDWVMKKNEFAEKDKTLILNAFLPRKLYGEYLSEIWKDSLNLSHSKKILISEIDSYVIDIDVSEDSVRIHTENGEIYEADFCIIATGNNIPGDPAIKNKEFYQSKNYFKNPWNIDSVKDLKNDLPVLIIGNGLTMVDTVFGLMEQGFKGEIFSISNNGFNILPHRHSGIKYSKLTEELKENFSLFELLKLVNKHIKTVREFGISAEPVIDSLRPHTQKIWKSLSDKERKLFMLRLRHLWGVARHRLPLHSHDKIQQLRIEGKLHINAGKILDINETDNGIVAEYFDKKENKIKILYVSRVINCTGPESDLMKSNENFLRNCLIKGIISQDNLKLGISTDTETFNVLHPDGKPHKNLFTIGSNLRGELWESTAVNELRSQAEKLAGVLLSLKAK